MPSHTSNRKALNEVTLFVRYIKDSDRLGNWISPGSFFTYKNSVNGKIQFLVWFMDPFYRCGWGYNSLGSIQNCHFNAGSSPRFVASNPRHNTGFFSVLFHRLCTNFASTNFQVSSSHWPQDSAFFALLDSSSSTVLAHVSCFLPRHIVSHLACSPGNPCRNPLDSTPQTLNTCIFPFQLNKGSASYFLSWNPWPHGLELVLLLYTAGKIVALFLSHFWIPERSGGSSCKIDIIQVVST
jgi:hypothetical protein